MKLMVLLGATLAVGFLLGLVLNPMVFPPEPVRLCFGW